MAAGAPGQWASVIFVAAQVHTRVCFLFLSFSISLTILLISHFFFFLLQKKKIYIYYFSTQIFSANISYFFFLSILSFKHFFFLFYLTMIFLSLININTGGGF